MRKLKLEHLIIILVIITIAKFVFSKQKYNFLTIYNNARDSQALKSHNTDINKIYRSMPQISNCFEGQLIQSEKEIALGEVNLIRGLHNLKSVSYDNSSDILTSKSALITVANNQLNHYPKENFKCWTSEGSKGSGTSNLFIGYQTNSNFIDTKAIIDGFLIDQAVESLGHRRWLLSPFLKVVSFGRVDGKSLVESKYGNVTGAALKVINEEQQNIEYDNIEYVAYPYLDYPQKLFEKDWYLSFSVIYNKKNQLNNNIVDFSNVSVEVFNELGEALKINSLKSNNDGFGVGNFLQWKVDKIEYGKKYKIRINSLKVNNEFKNYEYWFKLS